MAEVGRRARVELGDREAAAQVGPVGSRPVAAEIGGPIHTPVIRRVEAVGAGENEAMEVRPDRTAGVGSGHVGKTGAAVSCGEHRDATEDGVAGVRRIDRDRRVIPALVLSTVGLLEVIDESAGGAGLNRDPGRSSIHGLCHRRELAERISGRAWRGARGQTGVGETTRSDAQRDARERRKRRKWCHLPTGGPVGRDRDGAGLVLAPVGGSRPELPRGRRVLNDRLHAAR